MKRLTQNLHLGDKDSRELGGVEGGAPNKDCANNSNSSKTVASLLQVSFFKHTHMRIMAMMQFRQIQR